MVLIKLYKKYPAYALLQIASIITSLSSWASFLAMLILLGDLTNSGISFGSLWALSGLIPLLLGYFIGVWIDRIDIKKLIFWTEIIAAIGFSFFILLSFLDKNISWLIFLSARFFILLAGNINSTSISVAIPQIVDKQDLTIVNSFNFSINNIIRLSGASIGGVLLAISSLQTIWIINIVCCLIAAVLSIISQKYYSTVKKTKHTTYFLKELKDGFSFSKNNRWVFSIILTAIFTGILIGSFNLMLQQFTKDIYNENNHIISYLYLAQGGTSFLVAYLLAAKNFMFKTRIPYGITYISFGLSWIFFGLTESYIQGMLVLMLFAIFGAFNGPYERTTMQNEVPTQLRGRVFSIWGTTYAVSIQIGAFLTGVIISFFGIRFVPYITGALETFVGFFIILLSIKFGSNITYKSAKKITKTI
ncbi:MFS transporter [Bacillus cereus]|nr:MFS transporter [Bacillus cereus]PGP79241.1 MFS transporter [Bacillus cereus]